jgi:hypothetical protein
MSTATAKTLEEMQQLVAEYSGIETFIESDDPEKQGGYSLTNIYKKESLAKNIVALLPAFLDSLAGERQRLVEVACEMQRRECCDAVNARCLPRDSVSYIAGFVLNTACPPLESILERMKETKS